MSIENNNFKKPMQVYLTKLEWDMLEALESLTNAESMSDVIRAALLKYYKLKTEVK